MWICGYIEEDLAKAEKHEKLPITGLEFKIGSIFGIKDSALNDYLVHEKADNKLYVGRDLVIIPDCKIVPQSHERRYFPKTYLREIEDEKNYPILKLLWTFWDDLRNGYPGDELLKYLRELTDEQYTLAEIALKTPGSRIDGPKKWSELDSLMDTSQNLSLELCRGILPKQK